MPDLDAGCGAVKEKPWSGGVRELFKRGGRELFCGRTDGRERALGLPGREGGALPCGGALWYNNRQRTFGFLPLKRRRAGSSQKA